MRSERKNWGMLAISWGGEEKSVDNLSFAHVFEGGKRMFRTNFPWEKFAWHFWRAYQGLASHILPYIVSDKEENGGVGKWRS